MASTRQPATNAHLFLNEDFSDMTIRCGGEKQVKDLQGHLSATKSKAEKEHHEAEMAHEEEMVDGLVEQLCNRTSNCRNGACDELFGKSSAARKDHEYYGEARQL